MSAPAPPPDTSLDLNVDVTFLRAEFWFDMLEKAVLVVVNSMTACILLVIFSLVICLLTSTIRRVGSNPKRPVSPQILHFMISLVKAILWMAVIPILIMRIGIASDSLVAVVTSITLSVAMSVRPLAENLFAGVALLAEKIYSVGDVVVLAGSRAPSRRFVCGTVLENPNSRPLPYKHEGLPGADGHRVDQGAHSHRGRVRQSRPPPWPIATPRRRRSCLQDGSI